MSIFSLAFILGAVIVFSSVSLVGISFNASLSPALKLGIVVTALTGLALIDLISIKKERYCLLGFRRQTPKTLAYRYQMATVAAVWGLDTGLAVTTFRVAAITWGALVMVVLGFSSWWTGFGYGLGFILPLTVGFLWSLRERGAETFGLKLENMVAKRSVLQFGSAALLFVTGMVLALKYWVSEF